MSETPHVKLNIIFWLIDVEFLVVMGSGGDFRLSFFENLLYLVKYCHKGKERTTQYKAISFYQSQVIRSLNP